MDEGAAALAVGLVAFIGVIVGGLITAITTLGVEWMRARKESQQASERRTAERWIERQQFQRETLLALQEAIDPLLVNNGALSKAIWEDGLDAGHPRRNELRRDCSDALDNFNRLRSRVDDEGVRTVAASFATGIWDFDQVPDQDAASAAQRRLWDLSADMEARSGELIRGTFDLGPAEASGA